MLEGIPKREYPKLFYRYFKEFLEVLSGKTSLKLYLARNYPSLYKPIFREEERLKYKGFEFKVPKCIVFTPVMACVMVNILDGQYSIQECHIKAEDVVFDVGDHFGFFSYYAVQNRAEEVYAFEPNPYVFEILKKNAEMWSEKIKPYQLALSSQNGEAELFISDDFGLASTILQNRQNTMLELHEYKKSVKVKTTTIDEFIRNNEIERVDFIKIDAEGAEREIIKGAKETIKKFKPRMAIAAYHLPDDKKVIPELVLSIRDDYKYKLVNNGEEDLFFF